MPDGKRRGAQTEIAYGSLQFANNAFATFSGVYLPFIYLGRHAQQPGIFFGAVVLATVLQVLTAPAIGAYVQAAGLGAARATAMLTGAIPFALGFALVSMPPHGLSAALLAIWICVTLVLANVSRSIFEVSYTSMLADLSSAGLERTRLANFRQLFATAGDAAASLLPGLGMTLGLADQGYAAFGIAMAAWIVAASIWMRLRLAGDVRFNTSAPLSDAPSNQTQSAVGLGILTTHLGSKPFRALLGGYAMALIGVRLMLGLFPFLIVHFGGGANGTFPFMLAVLAGSLVGLPVWGKVAARWGRARAFRMSLVASALTVLAVVAAPAGARPLFLFLFMAMGTASIAITSFGVALQADLVDLEQERIGIRAPAAIAGLFVSVSRASQGLGTALVAVVIFATQAVDRGHAQTAMLYAYGVAGSLTFLLASLIIRGFPVAGPAVRSAASASEPAVHTGVPPTSVPEEAGG